MELKSNLPRAELIANASCGEETTQSCREIRMGSGGSEIGVGGELGS